jgi:hypothetical protein
LGQKENKWGRQEDFEWRWREVVCEFLATGNMTDRRLEEGRREPSTKRETTGLKRQARTGIDLHTTVEARDAKLRWPREVGLIVSLPHRSSTGLRRVWN